MNTTINATNRILIEHLETVEAIKSIEITVKQTYNSLNNSMKELLNNIRESLMLLNNWMEELKDTRDNLFEKIKEIASINKTINDHLDVTGILISKAREDATNAVSVFDSLVSRIAVLEANITDATETSKSAYDTAKQRYNNASIVFNVTSHLKMLMSNDSFDVAEVIVDDEYTS